MGIAVTNYPPFLFPKRNSSKIHILQWLIHDGFINLLISLTYRIILRVKFVWFPVRFDVKLGVWKSRIGSRFGNHQQIVRSSELVLRKLMLIWPIITFSETFNLKRATKL